jgi:hypothetical protein
LLDLGLLMGNARILDRQFMQAELLLYLEQQGLRWLLQSDPDEGFFLPERFADLVDLDIADALAIPIGHAVPDHAFSVQAVSFPCGVLACKPAAFCRSAGVRTTADPLKSERGRSFLYDIFMPRKRRFTLFLFFSP